MKKLLASFLIICTLISTAIAQKSKVVLCTNYDKTTGITTGEDSLWSVDKETGSSVYIIYSQGKIISEPLTLQIDKKNKIGKYVSYDRKNFTIKPADKKKWAMYDFKFTEAGSYKISVLGKGNVALAKTPANISYMEAGKEPADTSITTDYYKNSIVAFGESADSAVLQGEATKFKIVGNKRKITCMISNTDAFMTKQITIYLYTGNDYKEKVYTESYNIGGLDWDWIKLPVEVTKPGKYVADFYNDNNIYINSGYFEVTK